MKSAIQNALISGFLNYEKTIKGLAAKSVEEYEKDILLFFRFLIMAKHEYRHLENVSFDRLNNEINDTLILSVTRDDIYSFLYYISEDRHAQAATRKRRLAALNAFYRYLKTEESAISENPAENIPLPRLPKTDPKALTVNEANRLLDAVNEKSRFKERDVCILTFLLHLGLRREELVNIDLPHIKEWKFVHIHGKGNKDRTIPLDSACRAALYRYIPKRITPKNDKDINALFVSRNSRRMTASSVYLMIKNMAAYAGLDKNISPHVCRHTFATLLLENSSDIVTLQELMGHESISTTEKYVHLTNKKHFSMTENNPLNEAVQTDMNSMGKGK